MTIKEIIKEQDEKFDGFYWEKNEFAGRPLGIQEYLKHLHSRDKAILEGVVLMMNELETQKFLDKKCQVGDFVKLDDVLSTLKELKND